MGNSYSFFYVGDLDRSSSSLIQNSNNSIINININENTNTNTDERINENDDEKVRESQTIYRRGFVRVKRDQAYLQQDIRVNKNIKKGKPMIYKRDPRCQLCKQNGQANILITNDNYIKCSKCEYSHTYNLEVRNKGAKFITFGKRFNRNIKVAQSTNKVNNIQEFLGIKFSTNLQFSRKLPPIIHCNFLNFDQKKEEISSFYANILYMPFEIRISTIEGAGMGMFATEDLEEGTIVGAYVGYICHSFEVDPSSDSIFHIGWYIQNSVYYLILCDGNLMNEGSRFINSNNKKDCNCKVFLGVFQGKPINLIITSRQIEKDEELFFNYGPLYWKNNYINDP